MLLRKLQAVTGSLGILLDIKKPAKLDRLRVFVLLRTSLFLYLVPMAGFEPARLASPPPQDGVSTNFTTSAKFHLLFFRFNCNRLWGSCFFFFYFCCWYGWCYYRRLFCFYFRQGRVGCCFINLSFDACGFWLAH